MSILWTITAVIAFSIAALLILVISGYNIVIYKGTKYKVIIQGR